GERDRRGHGPREVRGTLERRGHGPVQAHPLLHAGDGQEERGGQGPRARAVGDHARVHGRAPQGTLRQREASLQVLMDKFIDAFINQWVPIVNHWLHLMSAILWIGGLGLLMVAVVPSLKKSDPGELVKPPANPIYRKYQRIIAALMLLIPVTGGTNLDTIDL